MSADAINIPDNVLMHGMQGYSASDQEDLLWLFGWATDEGLSRSRLCELLESDWSTVIRVAQGKYSAGIGKFMSRVRLLRERAEHSVNTGFIETPVTERIFDLLNYALAGDIRGGKMVMICGHSGRSKTESALEWCRRNNHGRAVYVECPVGGGRRALLQGVASKSRINLGRKSADIMDRIAKSYSSRRILVIDEVARLLPRGRRRGIPDELEFIRWLHDQSKCAVALFATWQFAEEISSGSMEVYFEQLLGRIADPLYLPQEVMISECRAICQAYVSRPSAELVKLAHTIANQPGRLRILFELLEQSAILARAKKEKLQARHLTAAWKRRSKVRTNWE